MNLYIIFIQFLMIFGGGFVIALILTILHNLIKALFFEKKPKEPEYFDRDYSTKIGDFKDD